MLDFDSFSKLTILGKYYAAIIIGVAFFVCSSVLFSPKTLAYSCGDSSGNHCYALERTDAGVVGSNSGFYGIETNIYVANFQCDFCNINGGFVDNEMWLYDYGHQYWVELGYITVPTELGIDYSEDFFWGSYRPEDCNQCVNFHDLGPVGNSLDRTSTFYIWRDRVVSSQYDLRIDTPSGGIYSVSQIHDTMISYGADMGQELAGGAGAGAADALFSHRYYQDDSGGWYPIGAAYYQPVSRTNPPYIVTPPNPPFDFYTWCC